MSDNNGPQVEDGSTGRDDKSSFNLKTLISVLVGVVAVGVLLILLSWKHRVNDKKGAKDAARVRESIRAGLITSASSAGASATTARSRRNLLHRVESTSEIEMWWQRHNSKSDRKLVKSKSRSNDKDASTMEQLQADLPNTAATNFKEQKDMNRKMMVTLNMWAKIDGEVDKIYRASFGKEPKKNQQTHHHR